MRCQITAHAASMCRSYQFEEHMKAERLHKRASSAVRKSIANPEGRWRRKGDCWWRRDQHCFPLCLLRLDNRTTSSWRRGLIDGIALYVSSPGLGFYCRQLPSTIVRFLIPPSSNTIASKQAPPYLSYFLLYDRSRASGRSVLFPVDVIPVTVITLVIVFLKERCTINLPTIYSRNRASDTLIVYIYVIGQSHSRQRKEER